MKKAVILVLFAVFSYAEVLPYLDKNDDFKIVKNLNIIIDRWNKTLAKNDNQTSPLLDELVRNTAQSIDGANIRKDELSYGVVFENLYKAKNDLLFYKNIDIDPFPTAKTSKVCKQILDKKLFLQKDNIYQKNKYVVYSDNASKRLLFSTTRFGGTSNTPSFFDIKIDNNTNENNKTQIQGIINIFEEKPRGYSDDAMVEIYAWLWGDSVNIFSINDTIYLNLFPYVDRRAIYEVFVYDKEGKFFDQACEIKRSIVGYKDTLEKQSKLCQKVIGGQYTKPEETNLTDIFDNASLAHFKEDITHVKEKFRWVDINTEYDKALWIDYDNNGEKKLLFNGYYASGAGAGCDYRMYLTYAAKKQEKFTTLAPDDEGSYFYTKHIFNCFQKEELITVDDKNYILTAFDAVGSYNNNKDIYALYEMKRDKNGILQSEQVCEFVPDYKYE
jgi:hypothetical protein